MTALTSNCCLRIRATHGNTVDRDDMTEFAVNMFVATSRSARICQRGEEGKKGVKIEGKKEAPSTWTESRE